MKLEQFNEIFNVGDDVVYMNDFGHKEYVKTRSKAWTLGDGITAVVLLDGKRGGYDISRISKA